VLFTDVKFVLLVAGCWLSFARVAPRWRGTVLALWGTAFYLVYAAPAAPIVFGLILLTYFVPSRRSIVTVTPIIAVLAFYKLAPGSSGLSSVVASNAAAGQRVLVPLGLSFLTFELIHFAVERKRGRTGDVAFADFMAYALYFPCRVAGPIRRYPEFTRSMIAARPSVESVYDGLLRVLLGAFKKLAIADVLGLTVNEIAYVRSPGHAGRILLAYTLEIYFDFSAYSDIAIGISRMFAITVPENFRNPYFSSNIQEFWTRWHISLSSWVRDYVFLPLGKAAFDTPLRERPMAIAIASYLIAFLVMGAWHGLTPNFILWGSYHGVLLSAHHVYRRTIRARVARSPFANPLAAKLAATIVTFALVAVGWVLFMTPDLAAAGRLLRLLSGRT